jgi:hypothetical protein
MNLKTNISKQDRAVALVITLLMLSVITFLAIAFISMTKRDRSAVTATLDVDTARTMSDAALARAQTEIIAQMMGQGDILSYDYMASHNYISSSNFYAYGTPIADSNNVNYDSLLAGQGASNTQTWAENIGNLLYDPRPPVFVTTNGNPSLPADFRYWVDINRNGHFESNGYVQVLDNTGKPIPSTGPPYISNFFNGEPEWIGVLKYPEYVHSPTNPFIGRYAFMVLPIGKTLDLNFIHNHSKFAPSGDTQFNSDGFTRDQGVGSWEINLAALLFNAGPAMYQNQNPANYAYFPDNTSPNSGEAFDDASQFLRFRYASTYGNSYPFSLDYMLGNPPLSEVSNIDEYALYPSTTYPVDYAGFPLIAPGEPWPGSYNSNMFYDVQDFFDPNKTGTIGATAGSQNFYTRLTNAGAQFDTTNRYTFQRLLASIGMSSQPEYGVYVYSNIWISNNVTVITNIPPPSLMRTKVNINYDNTAQIQEGPYNSYGGYNLMPTNVVPWTPLGFFTNAADLLLRSQIFAFTNYLTNILGQYVYVTNGSSGVQYAVTPAPSNWIYATFGITNIPVYMSNNPSVCYNEQIHRMLQLAANIYAAANPVYSNGVQEPPIFRPLFNVVNPGKTNAAVYIVGYTNMTGASANAQLFANVDQWKDLTNALFTGTPDATDGIQMNDNVWGIPWIVGAVKGLPAFDQYSYQSRVSFDRKLLFVRYVSPTGVIQTTERPHYTNQFYELTISNVCAMDAFNPYSTSFSGSSGTLTAVASNFITISVTVSLNANQSWSTNINVTNYQAFTNVNSAGAWPAHAYKVFLQTNFVSLPLGYFSDSQQQFAIYTNAALAEDANPGFLSQDLTQTSYPTHNWTVTVTNHLYYALFDGPAVSGGTGTANLLDFVNLGPFGSSFPITQYLTNNDPFNQPPYPEWTVAPATDAPNSPMSTGVSNQILADIVANSTFGNSLNGKTPASSTALEFAPVGGAPRGTQQSTPLGPYANYTDSNAWMVCDPLVHYTIGDLTYPSLTHQIINVPYQYLLSPPMATSAGTETTRYKTGIGNTNIVLGDSGLGNLSPSDFWSFPTNLFPGVGWIGRVHRGTPWQTVYLKSDVPSQYPAWLGWVNSQWTYPTNDWSIVDLFTAVPNDNAARGLLSVNQTNDAAWAAVLAGVIALTTTNGVAINPTTDISNIVDTVNGINASRATNVNGLFHKIGDILQASTLTVNSPYVAGTTISDDSDEMVERIPQQTLSLLKVGLPQFVIYSWGQSLRPKSLYSGGPDYLLNICTNYEITGEYLTRTVCHIVGDPGASSPKIVIDNYNIMPGN